MEKLQLTSFQCGNIITIKTTRKSHVDLKIIKNFCKQMKTLLHKISM